MAIAMVLWHHLVEFNLPLGRASWLGWLRAGTGMSWAGVDLFFTLSGFFIGGILIDNRTSPQLTRVFYLRRAVRILPIYYVTLGAIAVALLARLPGSFHLFPAWVYSLFLTNFALGIAQRWDWGPLSVLWSISVEEQFYLSAPWVVRALPPSRMPWFLGGLVALAELARASLLPWNPHGNMTLHVLTPFRMDALAMGVWVAWAVRSDAARSFFERLRGAWKTWLSTGAVLLGGLALLRPAEGSPLLDLIGYPLIAAVFALAIAIVAGVRPPCLCGFLESRPLVHLGRHSYFIYLWHILIGGSLVRWLGGANFVLSSLPGLGVVAVAVAATWGAAVVSWRWFEGPMVALGHRRAY